MSEEQKYDAIIAFLRNELSEEESQAFARLLEQDENLRREVAMWKELIAAASPEEKEIIVPFREKVRKMVAESNEAARPSRKKDIRKWSWIFFVLASAGILWWVFAPGPDEPVPAPPQLTGPDTLEVDPGAKEPERDTLSTSPPPVAGTEPAEPSSGGASPEGSSLPAPDYLALAKEYYVPYATANRSPGQGPSTRLGRANEAYNQGKWEEAINHLNQDDPIPLSTEEKKLRAHAFFRSGQYERAMGDFKSLASGGRYKANAEWNLVLCQLAQAPGLPISTFSRSLEEILSDPNHSFYRRAVELQGKLSKIE
ncbi:MAG: hypothetical protein J5I98_23920 [Phaeodactylibacter sp.]|nr:hypothetical protein [Phaeodactylibacter sp.]